MTIRPEIYPSSEINFLYLTHASYSRLPSTSWQRAIFWEGKAWMYEGNFFPSSNHLSLLLFCPQTLEELWICLLEAFHLQQGKEEAEWVMLAIHALRFGIEKEFLTLHLSPHLSLPRLSDIWDWALENETLVRLAVQYRICLRLIYTWREDASWLNWIKEALPLLHANGNQLRQIRQGILSLTNNNGWSLEKILEAIQWQNIVSSKEPPIKRLETLLARLKHLRYPLFTASEAALKQLSQSIRQQTGWALTWPAFLEGDTITLSIPLKTSADIDNIPHQLSSVHNHLLHALEILRGKHND